MLNESVEALVKDCDGHYIDGTFGRGGHSRAILQRLSAEGRLTVFDKDPEAIAAGREMFKNDSRVSLVHGAFSSMEQVVAERELTGKIAGILLDLGVSSPQLDDAERGFSFLRDGPLDMRMNNQSGRTAAQWLAVEDEAQIAFVLKEYGEERFGRRMARAIVEKRAEEPITTTLQLANILKEANPRWEKGKNPATRGFQAIRIYINGELQELEQTLKSSLQILQPDGIFVAISFHSLEDRIVKRFFRDQSRGREFPIGVPVTEAMLDKKLAKIGKAVKATPEEIRTNVRSRSAVLRVARRLVDN